MQGVHYALKEVLTHAGLKQVFKKRKEKEEEKCKFVSVLVLVLISRDSVSAICGIFLVDD